GIVAMSIELAPKASYTNNVEFTGDMSWIMDTGKWNTQTFLGNTLVGENDFPGTQASISPSINTRLDPQGGPIGFDVPTAAIPTVFDLATPTMP
ncbi:MAG: hypothetical protein AAFX99_17725, partial [Myxococcota bacterium]